MVVATIEIKGRGREIADQPRDRIDAIADDVDGLAARLDTWTQPMKFRGWALGGPQAKYLIATRRLPGGDLGLLLSGLGDKDEDIVFQQDAHEGLDELSVGWSREWISKCGV